MPETELPLIPGISEKDFPDKKIKKSCVFHYSKDVLVDIEPSEKKTNWIKWGPVKELDKLLQKKFPEKEPVSLYMHYSNWVTDALKEINPNIVGWKIPIELKCKIIKVES